LLEGAPHVVGKRSDGEKPVIESDVADLEVHRGHARVLGRRVGRDIPVRPAILRHDKAPAREKDLEETGVPLLGVHDLRERTDLPVVLQYASVDRLTLVLVLECLGDRRPDRLVQRAFVPDGGGGQDQAAQC
jgi:hypothetical protein